MKTFNSHSLRFSQEMGATLRLAAPIAAAQVAQFGMGATDTVMLGALGRDAIAAGGLGTMLFFTLGSVLQGLVSAVAILIAHARGARDETRYAPIARAGYVLAILASIPLMAVLWQAEPVLLFLGQTPELSAAVGPYDLILLLATPAAMIAANQRALLAAMARPQIIMAVAVGGLLVNGVLNYGMIHGAFGLPKLGYLGSATATVITLWLQMIITALAMRMTPALRSLRRNAVTDWKIVREIIHLGWPIAITLGVETLVFAAGALLMGIISTAALAAHQITLQVAALMFMIPLGINQAAAVRVGFHAGAGEFRAARRAGLAALTLGGLIALVSASAILIAPREVVLLFGLHPDNPIDAEVIALAAHLLLICAAFQVVDGAQTIASGALRGLKDTRVPMVAAAMGYWAIGFPIAWGLAFPLGLGAAGVWLGLAAGLAAVAILLTWRFWHVSLRATHAEVRVEALEDAARKALGPIYPAAAE